MSGTALCICGGRSERFPDSDYECRCYGKARNSACTCIVNPGGHDGVMPMHDCPVHGFAAIAKNHTGERPEHGRLHP